MEHGKIIRQLRKNHGITQEQLCQGICSRQTLMSIESDGRNIRHDLLAAFLKKMYIAWDEYEFICNDYQNSPENQAYQLLLKKMTDGKVQFPQDVNVFKKKYQETQKIEYLTMTLLAAKSAAANLSIEMSTMSLEKEIFIIKQYLKHAKNLGRFELGMMANILFIFEMEELKEDYGNLQLKIQKFSQLRYSEDYLFVFYSNLINWSISRDQWDFARRVQGDLQKFLQPKPRQYFVYENLVSEFYTLLLASYNLTNDPADFTEHLAFVNRFVGENRGAMYAKAIQQMENWRKNQN